MILPIDNIPDGGKHALDALSLVAVVGSLADILPPVAAALAIIWTGLQIFSWAEARFAKRKLPKD